MDTLKRIEEYRLNKGWSIYKLAEEAGLSPSALSNMYARKTLPSLNTVFNICDAFGISVSAFFCEEQTPSDLTDEEIALIDEYRRMSNENKDLLRALATKLS